jgi:beta-xylosidase
MIKEWKAVTTIESSNNKVSQTILYSEDQIIIAKSEDELPTAAYQTNKTATKYSMRRPTSKRETMEMCGKHF